jgi:hypothetical protein
VKDAVSILDQTHSNASSIPPLDTSGRMKLMNYREIRTILDYWQAQEHAKRWADRQRQIAEGRLHDGPYTVANAVKDYLGEVAGPLSGRSAFPMLLWSVACAN